MRFLCTFLIFITFPFLALSQNISDCDGAIVLCGDLYTEDQASLNTGDVYEWTGACNASLEQSSVWYTFTVQGDGLLGFTLTPNNPNDDYDWGLFNMTDGGCAGITLQDGSSPEVSCNSWGTLSPPNGPTGISTAQGGITNSGGPGDLNGPPFNADLPVLEGQVYALVVMNWSNSFDGYTIDFSESSAILYDDQPPVLQQAVTDCANSVMTLTFSEPIVVESVQNFDFSITGPGGTYGITGAAPGEPGATLDNVIIITIDGQITEPGIYTIVITDENGFVEDPCGNLATESLDIELFAPLTFTYETTPACNGANGAILITGITGGAQPYELSEDSFPQDDWNIEPLTAGVHNVLVTDNNDCGVIIPVTVANHAISVSIPLQDSLSCVNPFVTIAGVNVSPDQEVTYAWTIAGDEGTISGGSNSATPVVSDPGEYTLIVTDVVDGCTATENVEVFAGEVSGIDITCIVFPNVVTPNGDGRNEYWSPYLANNVELDLATVFEVYELKVFNRWGNLIFESSAGSTRWKTGDIAAGTYFYTLQYETTCGAGARGSVDGTITVLR